MTGFGGPPAHIVLLRRLVVEREGWMSAAEFEDANAACGLLPGPASTQLAIFCAYRVGGSVGAVVGGLGFVAPAVVVILALSAVFFGGTPPPSVRGAGAGAGAAVAAVAAAAGRDLLGASLRRAREDPAHPLRWLVYVVAGIGGAVVVGRYLVLILLGCGVAELVVRRPPGRGLPGAAQLIGFAAPVAASGGIAALAWTAFKVGALSYGGGFVIIPLMASDAVSTYHWMTNAQFLDAVALGQVTPGPVVSTVAAVGYAAHGLDGGVLAAAVAFLPSFAFVLLGGRRFGRLRANASARAFLDGAGPAAIGAIFGAAIVLAAALSEAWQVAVLVVAGLVLLVLGRGVVVTLVAAGVAGALLAVADVPVP